MKFCGSCGQAVGPDSRFCTACGAPVSTITEPNRHHYPPGSTKDPATWMSGRETRYGSEESASEVRLGGPPETQVPAAGADDSNSGAEPRASPIDASFETVVPNRSQPNHHEEPLVAGESTAGGSSRQQCPTCGQPWPAG